MLSIKFKAKKTRHEGGFGNYQQNEIISDYRG